jgi:predicted ATPase
MSASTFITRVVLENYKSIAACDVALAPLTFLLGPNGAGKSNFLDALGFVRDGLVHSLDHAFRLRGGSRQIVYHRPGKIPILGFRIEFNLPSGGKGSYAFRIQHSQGNSNSERAEIVEEECRVQSGNKELEVAFFRVENGKVTSSVGMMPSGTPDRLYLVRASGIVQFREVYDALCDMQFYKIVPGLIRDLESYDPDQRLREDGSNLSSVLFVLQCEDHDALTRVLDFMRTVLPTVAKVSVESVIVNRPSPEADELSAKPDDSRIALVFQQKVGRSLALFGPSRMSEGTLRTLAILTALYQVDVQKRRPTLTAIEDVEAAIHPGALRVILDALQEASLTTQVLVTTHSPDLLDAQDVAPESILAVAAEDGVTQIGALGEADRATVLNRLFTVGQLFRATRLDPASHVLAAANTFTPELFEKAGA